MIAVKNMRFVHFKKFFPVLKIFIFYVTEMAAKGIFTVNCKHGSITAAGLKPDYFSERNPFYLVSAGEG